jgi:hypothetical protein
MRDAKKTSAYVDDVEDQVVGGAVLQDIWKTRGLQQVRVVIVTSQ